MTSTARMLLLSAAVAVPSMAAAQTVTEADAKAIESALLSLIAKDVADTGALSVKASGDRYEVLFDLRKAIEKNIAPWTLKDANSIVHSLHSVGKGLWDYAGQGEIRYASEFAAANQSASIALKIGSYENKGTFDESLKFIRKGAFKLGDVAYDTRAAGNSLKIAVKDYALTIAVDEKQPGLGDISADSAAHELSETLGAFPNPETRLAGAALNGRYLFENVDFAGIARLAEFWKGSAKGKTLDTLNETERAAFAEIIARHAPFISRLGENTSIDGVSVTSAGATVKIGNLSYRWAVDGLAKDAVFAFGAKATSITVDAEAVPPVFRKALPREAGFGLRYSGFKLSAMWEALADPKLAGQALTAKDFYTNRILPGEKMTASFDNTYVRSDYYDFTLSGDMVVPVKNPNKPERADLKLIAHDFDKTIKFLQDLSKEDPQMSAASFTALAMKGFGKVQADGSVLWHFEVGADGKMTVNGQPLPTR